MSWARYDDELPMNHKIGKLRAKGVDGIAALGLHLLANTYCRHNGTKGLVEAHVPELLVGRIGKKLAGILDEVGMFNAVASGGWAINDYSEFHDPNDPEPDKSASQRKKELSDKRATAGRAGGLAKASNATSKRVAVNWQTSSPGPDPVPITYISDNDDSVTTPAESSSVEKFLLTAATAIALQDRENPKRVYINGILRNLKAEQSDTARQCATEGMTIRAAAIALGADPWYVDKAINGDAA